LTAGAHNLSVACTPTDTTTYSTARDFVQLTVNTATPAITWATPAPITYPTPLSATQLDATANVPGTSTPLPGTFVYSPLSGTVLAAGTHKLSVTFTPADTNDYTTAPGSVQLTVNNPVPSITSLAPTSAMAGAAAETLTIN